MDNNISLQQPEFIDYLLKTRLKRVSKKNLENFYNDVLKKGDKSPSHTQMVEEIVEHYKIMRNNAQFREKFSVFIRDFVLCARESEYLMEIDNKDVFIEWVNSWTKNLFVGKRFNFYKHIYLQLTDKYLCLNESKQIQIIDSINDKNKQCNCLSFPSEFFLLVAYSKEIKSVFSKNQLLDIHDTREFEIIFRKNSSLVSIRGDNQIVRDFFTSAMEESNNPLSMMRSIFVGDTQKNSYKPIIKPRKLIKIESLKQALNGKYLDIDAPVTGDQATRMKISFKGMQNVAEETHPILAPAVKEAWEEQEKSRIGFLYNKNTYSFTVTTNGGLYFRQYAPEEVITYVLLKILSL